MTAEERPMPKEDESELRRFKLKIKNQYLASDIDMPDERFLEPHREHRMYVLNQMVPNTMPVAMDSFYFKSKEAMLEAMQHVKDLLPKDEQQDSETTEENTPGTGSEVEGSEENIQRDPSAGESETSRGAGKSSYGANVERP